jgi:hypothetical protein
MGDEEATSQQSANGEPSDGEEDVKPDGETIETVESASKPPADPSQMGPVYGG